jgi:FtsH-binding integral membrane protein
VTPPTAAQTARPRRGDRRLGLATLILAALILFVWVPLDVESGLLETVRRQTQIGDALAPIIAGVVLALGGVFALIERPRPAPPIPDDEGALVPAAARGLRQSLLFLFWLGGGLTLSLVLMRWAGPAVVELLRATGADLPVYAALRTTAPWAYIGYALGGTVLVSGPIALFERRLRLRTILIGAGVALLMILVFGVNFPFLLLPPNGSY